MPSMGCPNNALLVFQWHFRLVPMILYPPKVPFLSLVSAIPSPRKCYRNNLEIGVYLFLLFKLPVVETDVALGLVEAEIQVVDACGSFHLGTEGLVTVYGTCGLDDGSTDDVALGAV